MRRIDISRISFKFDLNILLIFEFLFIVVFHYFQVDKVFLREKPGNLRHQIKRILKNNH